MFDDVECLSDNCVNALLKTIEEPSDVNYFILINNKSQNILDTLKSPLINFFPELEVVLFNLFESLKDVKLFIINLT